MITLLLEECMSAIIDYRGKSPRKTSFGVPLITAKIVKGGRVETPDEFIDPAEYDDWMRRGVPEVGDVVITTEAPLGEVAQLSESRIALAQRLILLRGKPGLINNTYLKYLLMSDQMQGQLASRASGTTVVGIKQSELRKVTLSLPAISEQEAIAAVLGSLDDKIEQNRRAGRALEGLARATFKAWFVDFEPVKAKAAGAAGFPGLPAAAFASLPDRLTDAPLGPVPRGWEVKLAGELASFILGGDWGKDSATAETPGAAYCIRGADIPDLWTNGMGKMPVRFLKVGSLKKRFLRDGDIVVEISGGSPTQSTGRPVLVRDTLLSELPHPLVCSNFCRIFRPRPKLSAYTYFLFRWMYDAEQFLQYENGTTGIKNFAFTKFCEAHSVIEPPEEMLSAFETAIQPILDLMAHGGAESRKLAALRDYLLPRLLSGRVRVRPSQPRVKG